MSNQTAAAAAAAAAASAAVAARGSAKKLLFLSKSQVKRCLPPMKEAVDVQRRIFLSLHYGKAEIPSRAVINRPSWGDPKTPGSVGSVLFKPGYIGEMGTTDQAGVFDDEGGVLGL